MFMQEWRQIRADIYDALCDYDVNVYYNHKTGHGYGASCAYFTVYINDDWDWDDVMDDLDSVLEEWELDVDSDSSGSFDLNALWDIND